MKKGYIFNIQKFCLHDGAGIRTDIFFSGCDLNCKWCCNPECRLPFSDGRSGAKLYDAEELAGEALKDKPFYDKSGGGVTLTGGEVFMQREFAIELCNILHNLGVNVAIETAGNAENADFRTLAGIADYVFTDLKHYSEEEHIAGTGVKLGNILRNISWLAESKRKFRVRIPVIPGYNAGDNDAEGFARVLKRAGVFEAQLMPFHQLGEGKYEKYGLKYAFKGVKGLQKSDLEQFANVLRAAGVQPIL